MKEELQKPMVKEDENWISAYEEQSNGECNNVHNEKCGMDW